MTTEKSLIISRVDDQPEALRARFQEWGYLYFQQYVSKDKCNALLQDLLGELKPHITFDEKRKLPIMTGQPFVETDATWDMVYPKIQALESFHTFFHNTTIQNLMKMVSGTEEVFIYPMKMARISTPGRIGYETPPHQDARSHAAGPTMAGIWIALHNISTEMGRLKILPRSHTRGVRPVVQSIGVGNVSCEIYPEEETWHVSDVQQGDVIIFHSACVHAAQANTSKDVVRMSIDTRFCDYGAPVSRINLEPHHGWRIPGLHWEHIYRNWHDSDLRYYWQQYPNFV